MKKIAMILACLTVSFSAIAGGNAEAGKAKSAACAGCHGADGNSMVSMYPKLAGQNESYIVKQLQDFKAGLDGKSGRPDSIMGSMSAALDDQGMQDVAAYYASQRIQKSGANKEGLEAGEKLYRGGNKESGVTACIACHGPKGKGNAPAKYPALGGQHPEYIITQLKAYQSGKRKNDPNGMMQGVAKRMTEEEMKLVANYIAGLH